ncbi:MAG TPA: ATPase, T2SS/T4P/T4SS family [Chthonomonadaceae bacterium]|nr:ATPase, T2SS/T4P/T4SS family [Chthonomonadaceae bacterium]
MVEERNEVEEAGAAEELLTIDEAARFLDTSKSTIYRILSLGELRGTKIGKQWRFRKADLTAYLERTPVVITVAAAALGDLDNELDFFTGELHRAGVSLEIEELHTPEVVTAEARIIALSNRILLLAITAKASDVHMERTAQALRVRFRIDGVLQEIRRLPLGLHEALIARYKEMSWMDPLEKRPQDGRIRFRYEGTYYDMRSNVLATIHGETMVIRNLDMMSVRLDLAQLGADVQQRDTLRHWLHRTGGMVLATGTTGARRTTLLYSCLREMDITEKKVFTIEDAVEYTLADVVQTQTHKRIGVNHANLLRCATRQDADVILCGELPDQETAEVAMEAALSGPLLLTTLHTEDAPSALHRLVDLGIQPYHVAAAVSGVVALRLVRRLCSHCKTEADPEETAALLERARPLTEKGGYHIPDKAVWYAAVGCDVCRRSGYQGRIGLFEILSCNPRLVEQLLKCSSREEMTRIAVSHGMRTLLADGMYKAVEGETTLDEVLRATATWL